MGHVAFDGMPLGDFPENPINTGEEVSGTATVKNTDWVEWWSTKYMMRFAVYDRPEMEDPTWEDRKTGSLFEWQEDTYRITITMPTHDLWVTVELYQDVEGRWKFIDDGKVWLDNPEWEPPKIPWWKKEVLGVPAYQVGIGAAGVATVIGVTR